MTGRRLRLRTRLLLAVVGGFVVAIAVLTVAFNVVLHHRLNADANAILRGRATADLESVAVGPGRLHVAEAADQAVTEIQRWVFSGSEILERPQHVARSIDRAARALADGPRRLVDLQATDTRLLSVPIEQQGRRFGTIVEGISTGSYEQTERVALIASLALAGALILLVGLAARWILGAALAPVARMTASAADWSEHDVERRFGLGEPRDEITQLAATLDRLLDRLGSSLRREQQFTAELSHELRTPLTRIVSEVQLALRGQRTTDQQRAALETVSRSAAQMQRTLDALLAAARAQVGAGRATADAYRAALAAVESSAGMAGHANVNVIEPEAPLRLDVEPDLVERVLAPVVENACRHASRGVTVTVERVGAHVEFLIADDGPGVEAHEIERIFEPGVLGRAVTPTSQSATAGATVAPSGAGLGLALARRLARLAGGDVAATADARGGRFTVTLPGA